MGYERYPRGTNQHDGYDDRNERGYGSGRDYGYSGERDDDRNRAIAESYGTRDRDRAYEGRGGSVPYSRSSGSGSGGQARYARGDELHGSYASEDDYSYRHEARERDERGYGAGRDRDRDGRDGGGRGQQQQQQRDYGRAPQGYDYQDRGFIARAGDEVRSWFGDEDAERRREADSSYDERFQSHHDSDYHGWRSTQIAAFDRDYAEYREENRGRFEQEFSNWRTQRQSQRDLLAQVTEHADVVGSDGTHVGTVDKVQGDRIVLTKNDSDAGGQHHSIPSRWLHTAEAGKVTLTKTAAEAKQHWRTEEEKQALFGEAGDTRPSGQRDAGGAGSSTNLNRSFPGTY